MIPGYVDALERESKALTDMPAATSVFFGGGTPSLLDPEQLEAVLRTVRRAPDAEVTVECNPETVTLDRLRGYRRAGVNRISLGVQSLSAPVLASLGRRHEADAVMPAVAAVRAAGFSTFNLDLIYGAAGESLDDWERTLDAALVLEPPHVSAYALTVEPGTPLATASDRHPDPDLQADMYGRADELLTGAGLQWYELSNWARPGHECRHSLLYWDQGNYRGLGCAAHSHIDGRRWWNLRTPERYIRAAKASDCVEAASETLDPDSRRFEMLSLALRTARGVPVETLSDLDDLVENGLVDVGSGRAVLTRRGRLLANEVAMHLVVASRRQGG